MTQELLKLTLEALKKSDGFIYNWHENSSDDEADAYDVARQLNRQAIIAAEKALKQPQPHYLEIPGMRIDPVTGNVGIGSLPPQPDYGAVKTYHEGKPVYVAQPEQEPVAYGMWDTMLGYGGRMMMVRLDKGQDGCTIPLYTTPPQPQQEQNLNCKSVQARLATAWGYTKVLDISDKRLMEMPPQRKPLTLDELWRVFTRSGLSQFYHRDGIVEYKYEKCIEEFARTVEAAHGIKE